MLGSFRKGRGNVLIWILMVMLIVGLGGWGIGVSGGLAPQSVARVGDRAITADDYVRALQQELRALTQRLGRDLPITEARQYGVDRMVLARLINDATLDNEAARLGLSASDKTIQDQILANSAFRGTDGNFSRDSYTYALERAGLRPAEFETLLRREAGRELVAGAVQAPAIMPPVAADTVLAFLGETRTFDWLRLDPGLLATPVPAPSDSEVEAEYKAHPERYTRPETRHLTYAATDPEKLAASIEIPEDEVRAAYDADLARYQTPERRALDRIAFPTVADAEAAKARLDSGDVTFDALATERGLQPADIDQGTVAAAELDSKVADAVFAAAEPGIVGPVETPLGPSLYRINAILAAATESFDDVKSDLAKSLALEAAQKQIVDETADVEDLIAGGATAEEIASETGLELGTMDLNSESSGGLADDPAFVAAADAARQGEETDLVQLANGGIATLRVDSIDPPAPIPLAEIRDRVVADWTADKTVEALTALADGYAKELHDGLDFAALAERLPRPMQVAGPITRGESVQGAPADLVADIFAADDGGTVIRRDGANVILAQLTAIEPFDPKAPETASVAQQLQSQFDGQVADDVLTLYTAALREQDGVTVNQGLIDSTLARFQ
jgi:peptidyl-prolyl cis-trans isomerase D